MNNSTHNQDNSLKLNHRQDNIKFYLDRINSEIRDSFTQKQLEAIETMLEEVAAKPVSSSPKLVDLRFIVDLIFSKFYVVLLVGKDKRQQKRSYLPSKWTRIGNIILAVLMLIGLNLLISLAILIFAYLIKSALGIDFFPGHINEVVQRVSK